MGEDIYSELSRYKAELQAMQGSGVAPVEFGDLLGDATAAPFDPAALVRDGRKREVAAFRLLKRRAETAASLGVLNPGQRHAVCNELYGEWDSKNKTERNATLEAIAAVFHENDPEAYPDDQDQFKVTMSLFAPRRSLRGRPAASKLDDSDREKRDSERRDSVMFRILRDALRHMSLLANKGSGRAGAYLRVVCAELDSSAAAQTSSGGAHADCSGYARWVYLRDAQRSKFDKIGRVVRMWNKLPCRLRGGSWPSQSEVDFALLTEPSPNGRKPFLDADTGEVMVYTTADIDRNRVCTVHSNPANLYTSTQNWPSKPRTYTHAQTIHFSSAPSNVTQLACDKPCPLISTHTQTHRHRPAE
jgi:hypothetical protein